MDHTTPLRFLVFLDTDVLSGPARLAMDFAVEARRLGHEVLMLGLVRDKQPQATPFSRSMEALGIPTRLIHERFRFDPGVVGQFRKVLEEFRPHVYQSHGYKGSMLGLIARRRGIPWQAIFHGFTWENWLVRIYHALDVRWLRRADEVVVVARSIAKVLADRGVKRERMRWIPNAISEATLRAMDSGGDLRMAWFPRAAKGVVIGVVGRFSPEKAPDRFLRVFADAVRSCPELCAVMVGDGPLFEACRLQAREMALGEKMVFAGFRTDLATVYAAVDVLVIPSHSEGLPTVMLEAMLLGVPVISTEVGAVPDIVRDGETALIVPEPDERALTDAIVRLARDPALRIRLAEAGQKLARGRLTVEARTQTLVEHVRCMCQGRPLPEETWEAATNE